MHINTKLRVKKYDKEKQKFYSVDIGDLNDELAVYTGYKDKYDKEIYSGDRISYREDDGTLHTATVSFNLLNGFHIIWNQIAYRNDIDYWFKTHKDNIKIIGNRWGRKDEQA